MLINEPLWELHNRSIIENMKPYRVTGITIYIQFKEVKQFQFLNKWLGKRDKKICTQPPPPLPEQKHENPFYFFLFMIIDNN